jgi:hypothetical protein
VSEEQQSDAAAVADDQDTAEAPFDQDAEQKDVNAVEVPSLADRRHALEQALAEVGEEEQAANAEALKNAPPDALCPTCGQLPPPAAPPANHREIWCATCGQKLADLPPGY